MLKHVENDMGKDQILPFVSAIITFPKTINFFREKEPPEA